jgi:hypothetical protein
MIGNMKKTILLAACTWASTLLVAQTEPATPLKPVTNGNPLCPFLFTADPTAVEYDGRLYVYGTNDTEECIARGGQGNTYGAIGTLSILSSDDLVNWTYHGQIPAKALSGSWCGNSWAPSIVSRVEDDGLTHFYLYFSNNGAGVGVLTSTSPVGPWTSPMKKALIDHSTPGVGNCSAPMDPGVVIDDNGTGWLAFGGGGKNSTGTEALPGNARIIKLKDNLIEVDGSASEIKAPYHFEANELNYMNGKWVYTYCSTWAGRDDWASLKTGKKASGVCSMDYMVSDDPLNPDSWKYVGEYFANPGYVPGASYYNNHTHLHKYQGNYYVLYHTTWLAHARENEGVTGDFRCMAINKATVTERLQYVAPVTADNKGVAQLKAMNPYVTQQAETTATGAGLDYMNFFNETNTATNLSHKNLVIGNIPAGAWTMVRGVDFGENGAKSLIAKLKGRGRMEIRLDDISSNTVAELSFSSPGWKEVEEAVSPDVFKGKHDVYFYFPETRIAQFDEWRFTENLANGIEAIQKDKKVGKVAAYNLNGQHVSVTQNRGLTIIRMPNDQVKKVYLK